jgi:hypothetical protein
MRYLFFFLVSLTVGFLLVAGSLLMSLLAIAGIWVWRICFMGLLASGFIITLQFGLMPPSAENWLIAFFGMNFVTIMLVELRYADKWWAELQKDLQLPDSYFENFFKDGEKLLDKIALRVGLEAEKAKNDAKEISATNHTSSTQSDIDPNEIHLLAAVEALKEANQ